jgi:hypothetical protein
MWRASKRAAVVLLALVPIGGTLGCTLDDASPPPLEGPSELNISIELRAVPDQLVADGFSSSVIEAVVREGRQGQRFGDGGITVLFDITTAGAGFLDLGNLAPLNSSRPIAGGPEAGPVSAPTDSQGVARVRYWAPFRSDQENDTVVTVVARPAGTDFNAAVFRGVSIFLRAANRPSFPGGADCDFIVEPRQAAYPVGQGVFFTAIQSVGPNEFPIARYEWEIEDGTFVSRFLGREAHHAWVNAGSWTVRLFTTESVTGVQQMCTKDLLIFVP